MVVTMLMDLYQSSSRGSKNTSEQGSGIIVVYALFVTVALAVYQLFAKGEFSSILTLSAIFQCLAFSLLAIQALSTNSVRGISAKSLTLDAIALACRLSSTTWLEGYLPADQTGDYLYQMFDGMSLVMVLWLLHQVLVVQQRTYDAEEDVLPVAPFAVVSLGLAALLHGDLDDNPVFDTLWICGLFISAVSVMPQLWMISKGRAPVSALTSHFVAVMAFSRGLSGLYMWHAHTEITCAPWIKGFNHTGYSILAAHVVHLLLLGDFAYFYVKHVTTKGLQAPLEIPEAFVV